MAGQGWREWTAGEQLTDAKMQQFLQDQAVMRFSSASDRTTELNGVVSEGMVTYLDDTNTVEVYDGAEWTELTGDPEIFTQGTAGDFLRSLGTAGVEWNSSLANPGTAGILKGQTGSSDGDAASVGGRALEAYTPGGLLIASVAFGNRALLSNTADLNTAVGNSAGPAITTGSKNVLIGHNTFRGETTGEGNTVVGGGAGGNYFNGSDNNTIIGHSAASSDFLSHTGSNNTIIGFSAEPSGTAVSNEITLGNSSIATLRCQVTSITSLSDERDKENIEELCYGLDFVKQLKPVSFDWNTRDGSKVGIPDIGFIAQDLVELEDANEADRLALTLRNNPDKLEATQGRLIPILVKAIQELTAKVEELENAGKH